MTWKVLLVSHVTQRALTLKFFIANPMPQLKAPLANVVKRQRPLKENFVLSMELSPLLVRMELLAPVKTKQEFVKSQRLVVVLEQSPHWL